MEQFDATVLIMIYFRGCLSRERLKEIPNATEELLKKAGINYKVLDNEGCCGSVLLRTGFKEDAKEVMQDTFRDINGEKVLVSCAGCYLTFKKDYPEVLGKKVDVIHTSHLFFELINNGIIKPSVNSGEVTYHDPCHLGRHMGEYETPRKVIKHYTKLLEMDDNRENSRCCGAGGGVRSAFPDLSLEIASMRLDDAKSTGAKSLVTCCPFCILNLKSCQEDALETIPEDDLMDIMDLSQFLLKRLNSKEAKQ